MGRVYNMAQRFRIEWSLECEKIIRVRVPRLLTTQNQRYLLTSSKDCWALFHCQPKESLHCFINEGTTWIQQNIPEVGPSDDKVMAIVFHDVSGMIDIDNTGEQKNTFSWGIIFVIAFDTQKLY